MSMIGAIIDSMMKHVEPHNCYGIFRVTPKRKQLRFLTNCDTKEIATQGCVYMNSKYPTLKFVVKHMTYILDPEDFILIPEKENENEKID